MTSKAAATLHEARALARAGLWDGAASRGYYAVYQALVAEFEARGLRAADFGRVDPRYPDKWPHWLVIANCRAVGLSRTEAETVERAERQRVKADYRQDGVSSWAVQDVLTKLPAILESLGVPCPTEGDTR